MAVEQPIQLSTLIAGADLSATTSQYLFVTLNSTGKAVTAGAGVAAVGVIQNRPKNTQAALVMVLGISKVVYGGTVTMAATGPTFLTSDANGKAILAVGNQAVNAIALEAGASGELHSVYLLRSGGIAAAVSNSVLSFAVDLVAITNGAGPTNIFTFTPGFAGKIISASFVVNVPVTTAAKLATVTCGIGTTAVTNAASAGIALTSNNCTPIGAEVKHAAITAANVFTATQTVTLIATAVTAFVEGRGTFCIVLG